jgi:hypothetical protein
VSPPTHVGAFPCIHAETHKPQKTRKTLIANKCRGGTKIKACFSVQWYLLLDENFFFRIASAEPLLTFLTFVSRTFFFFKDFLFS